MKPTIDPPGSRTRPAHLDLDSISLLVSTVRLGSLSRGAQACHMSLSAASRRLSMLEHALGTALLTRVPGGVMATPAGDVLVRHANRLLIDVERLLAEMSDHAGGAAGRVRIHANASAMGQELPARLAQWSSANAHIKLEVQEARSCRIVDAVRHGLADVGVVTTAPFDDLRFQAYRADRLCVVVPQGHALQARSVGFASLLDEAFVGLDSAAMSTLLMQRAAEAAGRFLKLRVQVHSFEALCRLVASGQGIGVMPLGCAAALRRRMQLRSIALTDAWAQRTMNLCTRHGKLAAPVGRFLDFLLGGAGRTQ